ncbi:hypothetical protein AB0L67_34640 [Streptomyces flaveolus]|uniref:Orn/Lys/Arg family decarboxylase n=1 Tax=Streptomyces flaveolus TaxID=67297 RepID=UPI003412EEC5
MGGKRPSSTEEGAEGAEGAERLRRKQAMLPRAAFFAEVEHVPAERAAGRVCAETVSPCPPGVPVIASGEVITDEVLDHLRSGAEHGVLIPDAADPSLRTVRVVRATS